MKVKNISETVAKELEIAVEQVKKKGDRKPLHVLGRYMTWSLILYFNLDYTVEELGQMFGYSHSAIVDGRIALRRKLRRNPKLQAKYQLIKSQLEKL